MKDMCTIDIEGDGLRKDLNQILFPSGNHFDPDTRIWCVTLCDKDGTRTYVHKIDKVRRVFPEIEISNPEKVRLVALYNYNGYTKAYHEESTVIPEEIAGHKVTDLSDLPYCLYVDFINIQLREYKYVFCKGFWSKPDNKLYNYDRCVLENQLGNNISNLHAVQPVGWNQTAGQTNADNQTYTVNGIRHNIEDAEQLYEKIIRKEVKYDR